jgi:hypothetical protein
VSVESINEEFRRAVHATIEADRPDLLKRLIEGLIDIIRHPASSDEDEPGRPLSEN